MHMCTVEPHLLNIFNNRIYYIVNTSNYWTLFALPIVRKHYLNIPYFFDQMPWLLFILLFVLWSYMYYSRAATIQGWHLLLQKACRYQQQLDKVGTSETVMVARHCTVSSGQSLSVLLSALEMTRATQIALAW